MRRILMVIGLGVLLTGGFAVTVAQDVVFQDSTTENEDVGASTAACATPTGSPAATLDVVPGASPSVALASTPAGGVEASPTVCATPEMSTPES